MNSRQLKPEKETKNFDTYTVHKGIEALKWKERFSKFLDFNGSTIESCPMPKKPVSKCRNKIPSDFLKKGEDNRTKKNSEKLEVTKAKSTPALGAPKKSSLDVTKPKKIKRKNSYHDKLMDRGIGGFSKY